MKSEGDAQPVEVREVTVEVREVTVEVTQALETSGVAKADCAPPSGEAQTLRRETFEEDEERFFSEPPDAYDETTEPSVEHAVAPSDRSARHGAAVLTVSVRQGEIEREPEPYARRGASARQRQLRRRVAGSLGAMLALLLIGFVARKRIEAAEFAPDTSAHAVAALPKVAPTPTIPSPIASAAIASAPIAPAVTTLATITPAPTTSAITLATTAVAVPTPAAPTALVASAIPAQAAPDQEIPAPPAARADVGSTLKAQDTASLLHSARSLLNAGHTRAGVSLARQAVEQDPLDAEPYILLAAGLQDLGAWGEARGVFAECQRKTKHGSNATCQYFARR